RIVCPNPSHQVVFSKRRRPAMGEHHLKSTVYLSYLGTQERLLVELGSDAHTVRPSSFRTSHQPRRAQRIGPVFDLRHPRKEKPGFYCIVRSDPDNVTGFSPVAKKGPDCRGQVADVGTPVLFPFGQENVAAEDLLKTGEV